MTDRSLIAPGGTVPAHLDDLRARVLLAALHGARGRGDRSEALRAWRLIVEAELERVRGIVRGFGDPSLPDGRIPDGDVDVVVAEVFTRLHHQAERLEGRSAGELRAFMRTATQYTCRDAVRAVAAGGDHRGGLLDADADSAGRAASDRALARLAEQLAGDDEDAEIARAIIHPALALVDDDKRGVLVMTESGYAVEEMAERFGVSRDTVHQRRRRGLRQLREAIRELAGEDAD